MTKVFVVAGDGGADRETGTQQLFGALEKRRDQPLQELAAAGGVSLPLASCRQCLTA